MTRMKRVQDGLTSAQTLRTADRKWSRPRPQDLRRRFDSRIVPTVWLLLLTCAGCSEPQSGPTKFPVEGQVLINEAPAERVAVTFHHADDTLPSNHRYATGVTNADGEFALSTEGQNDGALAGSYRVTFAWMSSPDLDGYDMLDGAFSDPSESSFVVEIPQSTSELEPFSLSVPEDRILRPNDDRSP